MQNKTVSLTPEDAEMLSGWLEAVAINRDKQAFASLFKWFSPKIFRFGMKQFGNESSAQELIQDTMTRVWRKAHLFDVEKGLATSWVYTVMRNASFDALRKLNTQKEDLLSDDIWPLVEVEQSQFTFADHLQSKKLKQYISTLPEPQQEVVKGLYLQELSQEQLANQLNIPLGTVKSRLRLALTKLKSQMDKDHD